ncbi:MAG: MIP/aquaporin family protein [Thermoanaerobaculia bacterium]
MTNKLGPALVAELIGTFALVFVGAGAGALGLGGLPGVALAHGLVVLAFAYSFGHLSGTHVNPAVTVGLLVAGKIDAAKAGSYIVFQLIGGVLGGYALKWVLGGAVGNLGAGALAGSLQAGGASITITPAIGFFLEALLAFFLVNTVLNAAVSGKAGNLAGLAIGSTLIFNILMGGPLTGAIFNPARQLGPALAADQMAHLGLYLVAPLVGAAVAGLLYRSYLSR